MAVDAHKNFAYSTVLTAPSPATSGTSLVVQSGDGTKFPAASFNATVWPAGAQPTAANAEIVRVTVVATDTFTITRTQESTSARTIVVGDQIAATVTAKALTDIESGGNLGSSSFVAGVPVQVVNATFSAAATGTTVIPLDDTIPQITEGTEFMTLAITPKSTTNILVIDIRFFGAQSVLADLAVALFQDSTANALAATSATVGGTNYRMAIPLTHAMAAGTTSATTFRVRAGPVSAATVTFNGHSGVRDFGAITKSSIVIMEYKA